MAKKSREASQNDTPDGQVAGTIQTTQSENTEGTAVTATAAEPSAPSTDADALNEVAGVTLPPGASISLMNLSGRGPKGTPVANVPLISFDSGVNLVAQYGDKILGIFAGYLRAQARALRAQGKSVTETINALLSLESTPRQKGYERPATRAAKAVSAAVKSDPTLESQLAAFLAMSPEQRAALTETGPTA